MGKLIGHLQLKKNKKSNLSPQLHEYWHVWKHGWNRVPSEFKKNIFLLIFLCFKIFLMCYADLKNKKYNFKIFLNKNYFKPQLILQF